MKSKEKIREEIKRRLVSQDETRRLKNSGLIQEALFNSQEYQNARCILVYVSFNGEVDTRRVIHRSLEQRKRVIVPRINPESDALELRELPPAVGKMFDGRGGVFDRNRHGISEPKPEMAPLCEAVSADLAVLPGVAFDSHGRRLGRGGGYYDRLLARLPQAVRRVGLAFSFQIIDEVPMSAHDQSVDRVLTN